MSTSAAVISHPVVKTEGDDMKGDMTLPSVSLADVDDDLYEDAGDLDFAHAKENVYLTRLPRYLWKQWSDLDDGEEVQIGTVRIEGDVDSPLRMSLLLTDGLRPNRSMPKEYNVKTTNSTATNTFVFTENDLAGYHRLDFDNRQHNDRSPRNSAVTAIKTVADDGPSTSGARIDKRKRFQQYYRRAIPKRTALHGCVKRELNFIPVENEEYQSLMDELAKQMLRPKPQTQVLTGPASSHGRTLLLPGSMGASTAFSLFTKTTAQQRSKAQETKVARMPQNELMDKLAEAFNKYTYWSLKSLKGHTMQPEAYLKETLQKIAVLVRQGPYAMHYQLKPESRVLELERRGLSARPVEDRAPDAGVELLSDVGEGFESEVDENVKMEDVLP